MSMSGACSKFGGMRVHWGMFQSDSCVSSPGQVPRTSRVLRPARLALKPHRCGVGVRSYSLVLREGSAKFGRFRPGSAHKFAVMPTARCSHLSVARLAQVGAISEARDRGILGWAHAGGRLFGRILKMSMGRGGKVSPESG